MTVQMISIAAVLRKAGDRVVVKAGPDEWFTGTIKRVGQKSVSILFDDKETVVLQQEDFSLIKSMIINFVSKEKLSDKDANPLWNTKGSKAKALIPMGSSSDPLTEHDRKLLDLGDATLYKQVQGVNNPALCIKWMMHTWRALNRAFFKNEMVEPVFVCLSYAEMTKHKIGGVWKADSRQLCLGVLVFDNDELMVIKALVHEMCHQAVSELEHRVGVGHGEWWGRRMYSCGLPAFYQVDITHDVPYMLNFEPADPSGLPIVGSSKREQAAKNYHPLARMPVKNMPVVYIKPNGTIVKGFLLGRDATKTQSWMIVLPTSDKYIQVDLTDLYVMPEDDAAVLQTPQWRDSVRRVRELLGLE